MSPINTENCARFIVPTINYNYSFGMRIVFPADSIVLDSELPVSLTACTGKVSMLKLNSHQYAVLPLIPIGGIAVFVVLYILAAFAYPGGSDANAAGDGFSILHNYWCELMDPYAINGQWNPARPIALSAMAILCLSLTFYWYCLPTAFPTVGFRRFAIRTAGILSMLVAPFVFTHRHDAILMTAGVFGIAAFAVALWEMQRLRSRFLFGLGACALALVLLCYYIFRSEWAISALPLLQKLAFLFCLVWFGWTSREMRRRLRAQGGN